jgi:hypothetical protein
MSRAKEIIESTQSSNKNSRLTRSHFDVGGFLVTAFHSPRTGIAKKIQSAIEPGLKRLRGLSVKSIIAVRIE